MFKIPFLLQKVHTNVLPSIMGQHMQLELVL